MSKKFIKISIAALLALLLLFSYGCDTTTEIISETESVLESDLETNSETESQSESEQESESESDIQTDVETESASEPESETVSETSTTTETETAVEKETVTEAETHTETDSETEPVSIIETESETAAESETETETETETESESETEFETESQKPTLDHNINTEGYAQSLEEALERSKNGQVSGSTVTPDQAPIISTYRPMVDGKYVKNNEPYYIDENTYVVVDALGNEVLRIYRGGGYITLEEVAAYVYAFGDVPANYASNKKTKPTSSIWGEFLRVNHSKFSGDTRKYPYEPALPRISGCGGDLIYYEIDIGTTGTDCDPSYNIVIYNNGRTITRGAARIVYARFGANNNKIIDPDEKYVFYTYNHYNDFQEYLNYFGGWGEMFGNITGGGTLSSKSNYNPTAYVPVVLASLKSDSTSEANNIRYYMFAILPEDLYFRRHAA